jgi:tetratricopeptide (TPR) repeat protein
MSMIRNVTFAGIVAICFGAIAHAAELKPFAPTPTELASLPQYCKDRLNPAIGANRHNPVARKWFEVFGPNYLDLHHFCFGLNFYNRAVMASGNSRLHNYYLEQSEKNFDYIIRAAKPGFLLLPEALARRGVVELERGSPAAAVRDFRRAIKIKPNYTAAYGKLSDVYVRLGKRKEARAALEKGLAVVPNSRLLRRKLSRLDDERH